MACPAVHTGGRFLADMLIHFDCQAQAIGAYGYGALADPYSGVSVVITGLLTLFVALFGFRLVLGEAMSRRDLMLDVLRVGIVLTLATSWPAWRTLAYNTVLLAPAEFSQSIGLASGVPGGRGELTGRLQAADDQIVVLTIYGTGRMTGGKNRSDSINDSFRGVGLTDQETLGYGRVAFLSGVIGPIAAVRLTAGMLLALAPLLAALVLFAGTRDLFFGWLRGLGACAVSAILLPLVYGVELAILEPWLRDAVAQRGTAILTPSAPTELLVIATAFALISFALLFLIGKIAFFSRMPALHLDGLLLAPAQVSGPRLPATPVMAGAMPELPSRALAVSEAVAKAMRRESETRSEASGLREPMGRSGPVSAEEARSNAPQAASDLLGDRFRGARRGARATGLGERRDSKR